MTNVLCIGGSTLNPGCQPEIRNALESSGILKNWAVIIAIHKYLLMYNDTNTEIEESMKVSRDNIRNVFNGLNFVLIEESSEYKVELGHIYILPDSLYNDKYNFKIQIFMKEDHLVIQVSEVPIKQFNNLHCSEESADESVSNFFAESQSISEPGDYLPDLDYYLPDIDDVMKQIAQKNHGQTAGLLLAGMEEDGAKGMLEICQKGGYTAVQAPEDCQPPLEHPDRDNSQMPNAAITLAKQQGCSHEKIYLQGQEQKFTLLKWLTECARKAN